MTVITRWSNLQAESYFTKGLLLSNTRKDRVDLNTLFVQSTAQIAENDPSQFEEIVKAAENVEIRFQRAWKRQNCVKRFFLRVSGLFGFGVYCSYHNFINRLAKRTAELYRGKLKDLVDEYNDEKNIHSKKFINLSIQIAIKNIETSKVNKGFVYQITNSKGVNNFLIGTHHTTNPHAIENKVFREVIDKSHEFIKEVKTPTYARFLYKARICSPILDDRLASYAEGKNKRVSRLEGIMEVFKAFFKTCMEDSLNPYRMVVITQRYYHGKFLKNELIEAWQRGDEQDLLLIGCYLNSSNFIKIMLKERNEKWLSDEGGGLMKKIAEATNSICVAVGCAHLFGDDGLISHFKKAGFTVTRIEA